MDFYPLLCLQTKLKLELLFINTAKMPCFSMSIKSSQKFLRSFFQKATEFPKASSLWSHFAKCETLRRSQNAGKVNCIVDARGKPSSGVSFESKQKQKPLHLHKAQSALIAARRLVLILENDFCDKLRSTPIGRASVVY